MMREFGGTCYLAIDGKKSRKEGTFEEKFLNHKFKDSYSSEDIKVKIRRCNFDIDKRGGLKLVLINASISLYDIITYDMKYELLQENCDDFMPILAERYEDKLLKIKGITSLFYLEDLETSLQFWKFSMKNHNVLNNEYLKYKNKYVICDGVIEKVKFSHFKSNDLTCRELSKLIEKGSIESYEKITKFDFDTDNPRHDIDYIYEIVQE